MRRTANLVVVATTFLASVSALIAPHPAAAVPSLATQQATVLRLDIVAMAAFQSARNTHDPSWMDWTSDGCSTPLPVGLGDTGRSYNFRKACQRHDFGYRNEKRLDRAAAKAGTYWNSTTRKGIDVQFLADMRADCAPRPITQRYTCRAWADVYYRAVRAAGGP
jgi:hypothetical protein